jgi:hypothetical protein
MPARTVACIWALALAATHRADAARAESWPDLAGAWRVFLPAGFEHAVTLTRVEENQYRLEPANLNSSGVYERQGDALVLIESSEAEPGAYRWHVHSPYLLSLVEQTHETGASYVGATLFRSNRLEPAAADKATAYAKAVSVDRPVGYWRFEEPPARRRPPTWEAKRPPWTARTWM